MKQTYLISTFFRFEAPSSLTPPTSWLNNNSFEPRSPLSSYNNSYSLNSSYQVASSISSRERSGGGSGGVGVGVGYDRRRRNTSEDLAIPSTPPLPGLGTGSAPYPIPLPPSSGTRHGSGHGTGVGAGVTRIDTPPGSIGVGGGVVGGVQGGGERNKRENRNNEVGMFRAHVSGISPVVGWIPPNNSEDSGFNYRNQGNTPLAPSPLVTSSSVSGKGQRLSTTSIPSGTVVFTNCFCYFTHLTLL